MNKKLFLSLITTLLLACQLFFPRVNTPTPREVIASTPTRAVVRATQTMDRPAPTEPVALAEFTIVRLRPADGELVSLLAEEAQKAAALSQMPVVEFDASWCPPCQAIDQAIKARNELMLQAYAGTYIIKLDVDEWGWGDSKLHDFEFNGIPVYFKLDSSGQQTGEVIDGSAWGKDIPENIAPVMDEFFHGAP